MTAGIVLIGPAKTGKTTLGQLLSAALDLPCHDLPAEGPSFQPVPLDPEALKQAYASAGDEGVMRLMMPGRAECVMSALTRYGPSVVELGAMFSIYDEGPLLERVRQALRRFGHTVLLLPAPDVSLSEQVLEKRAYVYYHGLFWNEYYLRHPSNRLLAKHVIYTQAKTPAETCSDILARLDSASPVIFLVGPAGAGKSTIGKLLAEALRQPQVSMDGLRWQYYAEAGWDKAEQGRIAAREGFAGMLDYWKRFDLHAVERLIAEHPQGVMDFGAGQTVFDDEADLRRVQAMLAPYPNIFLLLPAPDIEASLAMLGQRRALQSFQVQGESLLPFVLKHPANRRLASFVVYTDGNTAEQTRDEVLQHLNASAPA